MKAGPLFVAALVVAALPVGRSAPAVDHLSTASLPAITDVWSNDGYTVSAPVRSLDGRAVGEARFWRTDGETAFALTYGDDHVCGEHGRGLDVAWRDTATGDTGTYRFDVDNVGPKGWLVSRRDHTRPWLRS